MVKLFHLYKVVIATRWVYIATGQLHSAPGWMYIATKQLHPAPGWMYDLMSNNYITECSTKHQPIKINGRLQKILTFLTYGQDCIHMYSFNKVFKLAAGPQLILFVLLFV